MHRHAEAESRDHPLTTDQNQESRKSTMTIQSLPQAPEIRGFAGVARYQVRYTCLDSEGDQQMGTDPVEGIADAHLECARILEYQERWDLPEDARIWWRVGTGQWQAWGGVL